MRSSQNRGHLFRGGAPVVVFGWLTATLVGTSAGCGDKTPPAGTNASASASTSAKRVAPRASVSAAPAYSGPVGRLEGRVVLKGDEPPDVPFRGKPGANCPKARELSAKLFRVEEGGLLDAVVGVTEYDGSPPLPNEPVVIQVKDCVFLQRTYIASKTQDFEVYNRDPESYLPHLDGSRAPSLNVAVPGTRTPLHTRGPGRYILMDDLKHEWMHADVFVFAYRTHAVTRAQGRFVIEGIPTGKSKLSVVHPSFGRTVEKAIEIKEGETLTVEVEMPFDKSKDYRPAGAASASASASGSAKGKPAVVPKVVP